MKDSTWGKLKEPTIRKSGGSILEFFTPTPGIVISGLSEAQKTELKFNAYVTMALNRFCESNPSATRVIEGKREIDEVLLKRHLDKAIETDLIKDFGDLPDFSAG
jgi:hypothetical protein